jgi:signal transduction histidine kinase
MPACTRTSAALLESFLTLARAQHGTLTDRTIVSLDQVVIDALATHHDQIAEQQLEVRTALGRVGIEGSETLLTRMVENVIENSVRHNQQHGTIEIACETTRRNRAADRREQRAAPRPQTVAQLAQPFQRLAAERTGSQNGHGLGLSIVAAVANAHGGALQLHARPQGGLRVQITLPSATPAPATPVPA